MVESSAKNPTEAQAIATTAEQMPVFWAPDYKILYGNAFQIKFTDVDFMFEVATQQIVNGKNGLFSTAQVAMPLRTAKMLGMVLTETFRLLDEKFGPVVVPASKLEPLLASIANAVAALPIPDPPAEKKK